MEREKAQKALIKACAQILKCADTILEYKEFEKARGIELRIGASEDGEIACEIVFLDTIRVLPV